MWSPSATASSPRSPRSSSRASTPGTTPPCGSGWSHRQPDPADADAAQEPDPEARAMELLSEEASVPVDLEHGPLLRFHLVRVADDDYRLLRVIHHLITDRRSWQLFVTDAIAAYDSVRSGRPLPPPDRLQFADFAAWERRRMNRASAHCRERVAWW